MVQWFVPIRGLEQSLMRVQDAVDAAFRKLTRLAAILDGALVADVSISTTLTRVDHGLGRSPRGYIVVRRSAAVSVYDEQSDNLSPNLTLYLRANGTAVVSLWVF